MLVQVAPNVLQGLTSLLNTSIMECRVHHMELRSPPLTRQDPVLPPLPGHAGSPCNPASQHVMRTCSRSA